MLPPERHSRLSLPRLAQTLRWHRRSLAGALAMLAVLTAADAVRPQSPPSGVVIVAARAIAAGQPLVATDVRAHRVAVGEVPRGALREPPVGRIAALPIREGEILTDVRVLGDGLLSALGFGVVAVPVHLADAATAELVQAGDTVDVLASGEQGLTTTAARAARVLLVPSVRATSALSSRESDGIVVLAVTGSAASALARAAATARLSLVLRSAIER